MITTAFHGFCMALADSVPGVSGSTIAFIMGFYEKFLMSLHGLFGKDNEARKKSFVYLCKFGVGWLIGLILSILIISEIFEANSTFLSSLFLGLTFAAVPIIAKEEKDAIVGQHRNFIFLAIGIVIVVGLTLFRAHAGVISHMNFLTLNIGEYIYLAVAGILGISAMLLPGVSGSTLLLIFGVYTSVINAIRHIVLFDFRYLPGILAISVGVIFGAAFFSKHIRSALKKYRSQMIYFILGLLVGSLYAITMGPTTLDTPQPPLSLSNFSILGFIAGVLVLVCLEIFKKKAH